MADSCFWNTLVGATQQCAALPVLDIDSLVYSDNSGNLISINPTQSGYSDHGPILVDGVGGSVSKLLSADQKLLGIVGSDTHQAVTLPDFVFDSTPNTVDDHAYPDADGVFRVIDSPGADDLYESTDGINWTNFQTWVSGSAPDKRLIHSWTKFGSRLVANVTFFSGSSGNRFQYSDDDGATWVNGTGATGDTFNNAYKFFEVDGTLLAISFNSQYSLMFRSTDGIAWAAVGSLSNDSPGDPPSNPLAYDGSTNIVYTAGDSWGNGGHRPQHSNDDGLTWSGIDLPGDTSGWYSFSGVWFIGGKFVLMTARDSQSNGYEEVYTSVTGADGTWTQALQTPDMGSSPEVTLIR